MRELHIGHAIVSRAVFVGMREAVREMKAPDACEAARVIFGVGTDVVEIDRIEKALERWGERFARAHPVRAGAEALRSHRQPAAYLAKRFAAKEAFTKALGTGIQAPATWHGVWVTNRPFGQAGARVFTAVAERSCPARGISRAHLSLTDERGVAVATVILECEK